MKWLFQMKRVVEYTNSETFLGEALEKLCKCSGVHTSLHFITDFFSTLPSKDNTL